MRISKATIIKFSALALLVFVLILAKSRYRASVCNSVVITVTDSAKADFVNKNSLLELIYKAVPNILGYRIDSINIAVIDAELKKNPFIKTADIYKTVSGKLMIDVTQRVPILHVIKDSGNDFYIADDGVIFPVTDRYSAHTIVATGYIPDKFDFSKNHISDISVASPISNSLYKLAKLIVEDDFWNNQVVQIYVNVENEFELVPMVGNQILSLGDISDYDKKMYYLKSFYFSGIKKTDWNAYKEISVKYKNQIVCRRSEINTSDTTNKRI